MSGTQHLGPHCGQPPGGATPASESRFDLNVQTGAVPVRSGRVGQAASKGEQETEAGEDTAARRWSFFFPGETSVWL